jgi:hypothetical protein
MGRRSCAGAANGQMPINNGIKMILKSFMCLGFKQRGAAADEIGLAFDETQEGKTITGPAYMLKENFSW